MNNRIVILIEGLCQTFLSQEFNSIEEKTKADTRLKDCVELDQVELRDNFYEKEEEISQTNPKSNFPPVDLFLQSKKTLSSLVLDSEFYENLQIVRNLIEEYKIQKIFSYTSRNYIMTNKVDTR